MKLGIDAMGMDLGAGVVVEAVSRLQKETNHEFFVYGDSSLQTLSGLKNVTVIECSQVMEMEDGALAVRRKKDSSMVKAIEDLNLGNLDGVVSGGSTGALLASSTLIIKTLDQIERPALIGTMPCSGGKTVEFLDMGANAENTSDHLVQFAILGNAISKYVKGISSPKVALLNIGSEEKKGDPLRKETYLKLQEVPSIQFIGNIEGRDILSGKADVVVTDGFSGNIVLKTIEGTGGFIMQSLKESMMSTFITKIGAALSKGALRQLKHTLDYKRYGGALLAGLNKPVVKAHGSSDAEAFYYAIKQLESIIAQDMVEKMKRDFI